MLDRSALDATTPFVETFAFLDVGLAVRSDSEAFLDTFRGVYGRFRQPVQDPALTCHVVTSAHPLGRPAVVVDGQPRFCDDPDVLVKHAYVAIMNAVFERVCDYAVIHAGVVSWAGQGVLLTGGPAVGKTTLTLELVRRGFAFLSDDVAPLHRATGQVVPFPKTLGVRPGTPPLMPGFSFADQRTIPFFAEGQKRFVDVEAIKAGALGEPCPARYLFVLSDRLDDEEPAGDVIVMMLDRLSDKLLEDLAAVPGVEGVTDIGDWLFPAVEVAVAPGAVVELELEAVCRAHDVLVMYLAKGRDVQPDFGAAPALAPLSRSQAALELVRKFRAGPRSALIREVHKGDMASFFLELLQVAGRMRCYRLQVGRLEATADLICDVVRGGEVQHRVCLPGR